MADPQPLIDARQQVVDDRTDLGRNLGVEAAAESVQRPPISTNISSSAARWNGQSFAITSSSIRSSGLIWVVEVSSEGNVILVSIGP